MKEDINIIRNEWFKDHKATITKLSDRITTIDWKRDGSGFYAVRYVFDGDKLYITGDIGQALYWLTWQGTAASFKDVHFGYFNEKRECSSRSPFEYNSDAFDKEVDEYMKEIEFGLTETESSMYEEMFQEMKSIMEQYSHNPEVQSFVMFNACIDYENADKLDIDTEQADFLSKFGRVSSMSHLAYLEGLKMIAEQEATAFR